MKWLLTALTITIIVFPGITIMSAVAADCSKTDEPAVGTRGHVGCNDNPKVVQRLRITKPGIYENYLVDGKWTDSTLVKIKADNVTLRHCEIRNGLANAIYVDAENVMIDSCRIHHLLSGTFNKQDDAHGITGHPRKLRIRNSEIYFVSGDCIQFDPARKPWGEVLVENCTLWTGPLPGDAAGFKKGERPGENAIDTKQSNSNPRSKLVFRNCLMYGWKQPGQIGTMAAFNIKNKVEVLAEGCVFRDNQVSFRLRGGAGTHEGALVTIRNCAVYSSNVAVRMEDKIQNLTIIGLAIGKDVKRKYRMAGGGAGSGYKNTGEHDAPSYEYVLKHGLD